MIKNLNYEKKIKKTNIRKHIFFPKEKLFAIFELINCYFWKSKVASILSLIMPVFFMFIYYMANTDSGDNVTTNTLQLFAENSFPLTITLTILPIFLMTIPSILVEFKSSIILRTIKISSINRFQYTISLFLYTLFISIFFLIINFAIFMCFINKSFLDLSEENRFFHNIDWAGLAFGVLTLILSGFSIGMFIGILTRKALTSLLIGFFIFMMTVGFSGQLMPLFVIAQTPKLMDVTLAFPLNYSVAIINESTMSNYIHLQGVGRQEWYMVATEIGNANFFDLDQEFATISLEGLVFLKIEHLPAGLPENVNVDDTFLIVYDKIHKILNISMPLILSGIFLSLGNSLFSWTNR